ncbi:DUF4129 domain-containing protein [Sandaracinus amylolyticus]|uniref:Protein-glutamine gamma-glutamyltransferase-like C-terminal domain-containing protein n=1 Tax=Sandaracinus amylolyticus TaxID=927083 RepID=A0A0F6SHF5_9BACT|nr:DUF4129 domain-containing protein [Sandaracinus amylolyticus]AKF10354.1 hypothetical protein DB32_007503 [Sandaracinus amylolyticus]
MRGLATVIAAGASIMLALAVVPAAAQEDPAAVAARVREQGGYPADVTVLVPEHESGGAPEGAEGAGRGPRGETSIDGERESPDPGPQVELPFARPLMDWLASVLASLSGPLGYVFLALGLAVLALVIVFFAASMRFRAPRLEASARDESVGEAAIDPLLVGTGESADALAAQGRWREAIHALFLDSLGRVGGAEGRHRSRTARELVRAIDGRRAGRAELESLLDLTERVWFGARDADETQFRDARALADAVPRGAVIEEDAS